MGAGADRLTYGVNRQGSSEFSGNLNDAGERIALHSQREGIVHSFDYRGNPGSPAMDGYSLVLLDPESAPDHRAETSWLLAVDPSFGN